MDTLQLERRDLYEGGCLRSTDSRSISYRMEELEKQFGTRLRLFEKERVGIRIDETESIDQLKGSQFTIAARVVTHKVEIILWELLHFCGEVRRGFIKGNWRW